MPSETTTAFVSLLVFFRIRCGTFPYSIEDDARTMSQTPTTHYTNTFVKLTIVTHLSFSERIAIANLSLLSSRVAHNRATEDNHTQEVRQPGTEIGTELLVGIVHKPRQGDIKSIPL